MQETYGVLSQLCHLITFYFYSLHQHTLAGTNRISSVKQKHEMSTAKNKQKHTHKLSPFEGILFKNPPFTTHCVNHTHRHTPSYSTVGRRWLIQHHSVILVTCSLQQTGPGIHFWDPVHITVPPLWPILAPQTVRWSCFYFTKVQEWREDHCDGQRLWIISVINYSFNQSVNQYHRLLLGN